MKENNIFEMARGAILEQTNVEVKKIVENILDPNTDPKKKRQLQLTIDFTPQADRTQVVISSTAKSKLLPNDPIQTTAFVDANSKTGEVTVLEAKRNLPGQMSFTGEVEDSPKIIKIAGGTN